MLSRLSLVRLRLRLPSLVRLSSSVPVPRSTPPPVPKVQPNVPLSVSDSILPLDDLSPPSVLAQAPNNAARWSASQASRELAYSNARFEQTILEYQPQPLSAMEMIAAEPVLLVKGRKAVCDGGGGALGHPKVFINLDQPGPRSCGYCGLRFEQDSNHHHAH
ncbi:zinc-finger domain-containing protein [Mrakia frigida]|uniref:zinc-finger domain-containing protein n=1 Tax=Mrakia frigida TaxID=29902 RepID=UPI003FCC0B48